MVRDAFALAKEKAKGRKGAIIFIDEVRATTRPQPREWSPTFVVLLRGSWMPLGRSDSTATSPVIVRYVGHCMVG